MKKKKTIGQKKHNSIDNQNIFNISDLNVVNKKTQNSKKKIQNIKKENSGNNINNNINKCNSLKQRHKKKNLFYNKYLTSQQIKTNKQNTDRRKEDDLKSLLDNIKTSFKQTENKFINQQKNMKNDIDILREKLKQLSVNDALYQVEIEKLKRNKTGNINKLSDNNNINNIKENNFEQKLDVIIQNHSNMDDNNNNSNNQNMTNNNENMKKFEKFLEMFNLDKSIFNGENISGDYEDIDYIGVFNK